MDERSGNLQLQLSGFSYGFLIPIFFINVGIRFEIELLEEREAFVRAATLIAFAVKILPSLLFLLRGLTLRETLAAGRCSRPGSASSSPSLPSASSWGSSPSRTAPSPSCSRQ